MAAFTSRLNRPCLQLSFNDIANGNLEGCYDIIFISFALHLISDNSALYSFLIQLSYQTKFLCILSPHKRPEIKPNWGFIRCSINGQEDEVDEELYIQRVRLRLFKSLNLT